MDALFSPEHWARTQAYAFPYYVWKAASLPYGLWVYALLLRWTPSLYALAQKLCAHPACLHLGTLPGLRALPALAGRLWKGPGLGAALLFALLFLLLSTSFYVPVNVFFGYFWEHRFGLSSYSPQSFAVDFSKGMLLSALAMSCLVVGLLGVARRTQHWWWLLGIVGAGALLLSPYVDPWRARIYDPQHSMPASPLRENIETLLEKAQVEVHNIWVEENSRTTKKLQAYFAGQGASRTLVFNDNLLNAFEEGEVLAVVAHEAAHAKEDKRWGQWGTCLALLLALWGVHKLLQHAHRRRWLGIERYADPRILPVLFLSIALANWVVAPVSGAFNRARELEADRQALLLTDDAETFARMLQKLSVANFANPSPPRWIVLMGMSHPPPLERIQALNLPQPPPPP